MIVDLDDSRIQTHLFPVPTSPNRYRPFGISGEIVRGFSSSSDFDCPKNRENFGQRTEIEEWKIVSNETSSPAVQKVGSFSVLPSSKLKEEPSQP